MDDDAHSSSPLDKIKIGLVACLAALTVITWLEWIDADPIDDRRPADAPSTSVKGLQLAKLALHASEVEVAAAQKVVAATQQSFREFLTEFESRIHSARQDMDALKRDLAVEHRNGGDTDNNGAGTSEEDKEQLRSGFLQFFDSLEWCEKLLTSRLDIEHSVSHQEKRAWRQRLIGQVLEMEHRLGGEAARRQKIEDLEDKVAVILTLWNQHFTKKPGGGRDEVAAHVETEMAQVKDLGFDPIYLSMFSPDAVVHPSEKEGRRLHELYNIAERGSG